MASSNTLFFFAETFQAEWDREKTKVKVRPAGESPSEHVREKTESQIVTCSLTVNGQDHWLQSQ